MELQSVTIDRITADGKVSKITDTVVVEQPITIIINDIKSFTFLCTPDNIKALAIGFAFSEGLIDTIADITDFKAEANSITLNIKDPARARTLDATKSCAQTLFMPMTKFNKLMQQLHSQQTIYKKTGATHAAGIFNAKGKIIAFAEDVARHNALDKAIGYCLLNNLATQGCGVLLSSRVNFAMLAKIAKAGMEIVMAVSAATSLAIAAAQKWNITLCGFVRDGRANIYTYPERILPSPFNPLSQRARGNLR